MMAWRSALVTLLVIFVSAEESQYKVPDVQIEVLKSGQIRAHIPGIKGMSLFAFHGNVNNDIDIQEPGELTGETKTSTGDYWAITLNNSAKVGNVIYYWVFVTVNRFGYYNKGSWEVRTLQDSFTTLDSIECIQGSTTINNGRTTCIGAPIIDDDFKTSSVDQSKWIIEHRIPTYVGPNYEFNSYKNRNDVCFIRDSILYLKPKALTREEEVRGEMDLTEGCTSDNRNECYYKHVTSFILPPVTSAKLRSKTSFKYGRVEIRARLPQGDWIYPILELEPKDKIDGENSTKIWVAYSRGNLELKGNGPDDLGARILFGGPVLHPEEPGRSRLLSTRLSDIPYSDDFHVYSLQWKPGRISLYIDSQIYGDLITSKSFADPSIGLGNKWTGPEAPFDREYVLLLGVGIGGINDFPDGFNSPNDPKPWFNDERNYIKNFFDARNVWLNTWKGDNPALQIDYVKVTAV